MYPKLISIGDFFLPSYGVFVALGFMSGLWITLKLARERGMDTEKIGNLAVYCALAGLIGAKLFMFGLNFDYYRDNPARIFSFDTLLSAGVYYGGFIGALLFALYYLRARGMPIFSTMDVFSPGVALGHAIGRLGCFAAGCCWGLSCDRPWAVTFRSTDANALVGVPLNMPLHPAQLYEAFLTFLVFIILYVLSRQPHRPGVLLGWYFVLYSPARFGVEFFRYHDQKTFFETGLSVTQVVSLALSILGSMILLQQRTAKKRVGENQVPT